MSIKVHIHPYLRHLAGNNEFLMVEGKTVRECVEELVKRYPELDEWVFDKEREINNLFEIYLNMESIVPEGLAKPVKNGDEINLIITVAGG